MYDDKSMVDGLNLKTQFISVLLIYVCLRSGSKCPNQSLDINTNRKQNGKNGNVFALIIERLKVIPDHVTFQMYSNAFSSL